MSKDKVQTTTERQEIEEAPGQGMLIDATARFRQTGPEVEAESPFDGLAFRYGDLDEVTETAPFPVGRIPAVSELRGHVLNEMPSPTPSGESMEIFEMFHIGAVRSGALQFLQVFLDKVVDLIERALLAASLPTLANLARKVGNIAKDKIAEVAGDEGFDLKSFRSLNNLDGGLVPA